MISGLLFLPAAGSRSGSEVVYLGTSGYYSSTYGFKWANGQQVQGFASFNATSVTGNNGGSVRDRGGSVRLVCLAQ